MYEGAFVRVRDDALAGGEFVETNRFVVANHGWLWRVSAPPEITDGKRFIAECVSLATGDTAQWLDYEVDMISEEG
jgi:hypothetical protein